VDTIKENIEKNIDEAEIISRRNVDTLNRLEENFSSRLFWFAGIILGTFQLFFKDIPPITNTEKNIIFIIIFLTVSSMLFGIVDFFWMRSFMKKRLNKISEYLEIWFNAQKIQTEEQYLIALKNGEKRLKDFNKILSSSDIPLTLQTLFVWFGFILEVIYLLGKLLT
jgi:hypothetical protein